jgi:hypothetical protein
MGGSGAGDGSHVTEAVTGGLRKPYIVSGEASASAVELRPYGQRGLSQLLGQLGVARSGDLG